MINTLKDLIERVENMQVQMDNVIREMEILRKNQKEILEIKNTVIKMKNAFEMGSPIEWTQLRK